MPNISNLVKSIQDIMRKDAGTYGDAQRIEQMASLFFLKIFDDRETQLELFDDNYKSPLKDHLRWRNWAADEEGITGDAMLDFVNNTLLPALKTLAAGQDHIAGLIRMTFADANNYMKNGTLLRQVINKINTIDFNATNDRHTFGDIYEKILKDLQSAGNAGEFYTPRAVTQFIVDQVNPKLGETVFDPACGTGGFLTCAIDHLRDQAKDDKDMALLQDCYSGIEKKHLPHVLCMTNLMLHGIDVPTSVRHGNTLARPLTDWKPKEYVDCVITNPPFGGMEEDGIETNFPSEFRTRETADLFLVLIMRVLKPGGRAGLVLPDATLFGDGVKARIKEKLLNECNLHTIVRLPNGVFNPYTGIRTNLLFFTKGQPTKEVWFFEHPYPAGAKSYNKGKPISIKEFKPEKKWWGDPDENGYYSKRKEGKQAWRVSIDDIKARGYDLDIRNPNTVAVGPQEVKTVMPKYDTACAKLVETRNRLKEELQKALEAKGLERSAKNAAFFEKFEALLNAPDAVTEIRKLVLGLAFNGGLSSMKGSADSTEWIDATLESLATDIVPGFACGKSNVQEGGHAHMRTHNISTMGVLNFDLIVEIDPELVDPKKAEIKKGDIIFNNTNSQELVGKTALVDRDYPYGFSNHLTRIRLNPNVYPPFIVYYFKLLRDNGYFASICTRWINQAGINTKLLKQQIIPHPPLSVQKDIVAKVDKLMGLVGDLEAQLDQSRATTKDLLEAFVAELTAAGIPLNDQSV